MTPHDSGRPGRLAAYLFADIAEYTPLSAVDHVGARALVLALSTAARREIRGRGGRFKLAGDCAIGQFESAEAAVRAGAGLMRSFEKDTGTNRLRVGVHLGEVTPHGDNLSLGHAVNVASRVQGQASPGEVLVTRAVVDALHGRADFAFSEGRTAKLKGLAGEVTVHSVVVRNDDARPLPGAWADPRVRLASGVFAVVIFGAALGGLATAVGLSSRYAPPPPVPQRFAMLTTGRDALDSRSIGQDLAISPDGRSVAYVGSTADGSTLQIHLRTIGELKGTAVRGSESGSSPFFSPDGQWIGFVDGANPRVLKRVPVSGGPATMIATLPDSVPYIAGAAWGEDDRILVASGSAVGLFRVSADGAAIEHLTSGQHHWPAIVEGRDAVLFMDHAAGQHLGVLDLRTGESRSLDIEGTSPRYVSTGHLVYARADDSVWAVAFDAETLEWRGEAVLMMEGVEVKSATESAANFSISSQGHFVYAASESSATDIVLVEPADGKRSVLLDLPVFSAFPRFSPDGSRIAYLASNGDGTGNVDLWVVDVERGARTRTTFGGTSGAPLWAPDGRRLTLSEGSGRPLVIAPADGVGASDTLLVRADGILPTSWSPDGATLVYTVPPEATPTGSADIALLRVEGDSLRSEAFLASASNEGSGVLSPDGQWMAYVSDKGGRIDVYVRPFPGPGDDVAISVGGGGQPRWVPTGGELYYRSGSDLMVVSVEPGGTGPTVGAPRRVLGGLSSGSGVRAATYDVSPSGDRLVLIQDAASTDAPAAGRLFVVLNWLEELRARVPR